MKSKKSWIHGFAIISLSISSTGLAMLLTSVCGSLPVISITPRKKSHVTTSGIQIALHPRIFTHSAEASQELGRERGPTVINA
jgi:hypothetical protein